MIFPEPYEELSSYKSFKKKKFEHDKQKLLRLFGDIKGTSLKEKDKKKLIELLKKTARDF